MNNVIPVLPRLFLELQRGRALDPEPRRGDSPWIPEGMLVAPSEPQRKERRGGQIHPVVS